MREFHRCFPDANNFSKIIKLKKISDWKVDYFNLEHGLGYWIAEDIFTEDGFEIFKELIATFPIQKDNSHPDNRDPNPFDTIHLPMWVYKDICLSIRDFYQKKFNKFIADPQVHEWGNVYYSNRSKPITCWRIPHIDYAQGFVGNLWFTDHILSDSSTKFYKYHGEIKGDLYDFQVDKKHKMHERWRNISETPVRAEKWFNMNDNDLADWGFEYVGESPCISSTMVMYQSNISHLAFISDRVDFRWSHTFAFSHLDADNLKIKDILR